MDVHNDIESVAKRYKKMSLGYVAKEYSLDEEKKIYEEAASLISRKYGDIIAKDNIVDILQSKGRIFTMVVKREQGFYEFQTANICIPHFLRMTTTLLHELVHKTGYLQEDESFDNMNRVFKEAGTEYVSATSFNDNSSRLLIFNGIYSKFPEKTDTYFLSVCLVNQINQAIGGRNLEKSILKGKDYFKQAIIDRWGENYYINLEQNITDIAREEKKYWNSLEYFSYDEKLEKEDALKKHIYSVQDTILEVEFSKRFQEVKNRDDALAFLEGLKDFELNRVRERKKVDGKNKYVDKGFDKTFSEYKEKLEEKFGSIKLEFDEGEWSKKFPKKEIIEEVTEEEKEEIFILSDKVRKQLKRNNSISRFLRKVFKPQNTLPESNTIDKPINNYIISNYPEVEKNVTNNTNKIGENIEKKEQKEIE